MRIAVTKTPLLFHRILLHARTPVLCQVLRVGQLGQPVARMIFASGVDTDLDHFDILISSLARFSYTIHVTLWNLCISIFARTTIIHYHASNLHVHEWPLILYMFHTLTHHHPIVLLFLYRIQSLDMTVAPYVLVARFFWVLDSMGTYSESRKHANGAPLFVG